jgi:cyclase
MEDIELVLDASADKITMNSAAVKDPSPIKEISMALGSEPVTVAIDGKRNMAMPSGLEVVAQAARNPSASTR